MAAALAWASVALAGLGGYQILDKPNLPARLVICAALVLLFSTAMALAAAVTTMELFTAALTSGLLLFAAIIAAQLPGTEYKVSAVAVGVLLGTTAILPTLSYQLARIQLPNLPNTAEGILADDEPLHIVALNR